MEKEIQSIVSPGRLFQPIRRQLFGRIANIVKSDLKRFCLQTQEKTSQTAHRSEVIDKISKEGDRQKSENKNANRKTDIEKYIKKKSVIYQNNNS